jgi:hypothetical protein
MQEMGYRLTIRIGGMIVGAALVLGVLVKVL